jgi:hypothetical protein
MQYEVRDIYYLILGLGKHVREFKRHADDWPRKHMKDDVWYRGFIIDYNDVLDFLETMESKYDDDREGPEQ